MEYTEFLKSKEFNFNPVGFDPHKLNDNLFDFQKAITRWAIKKGRAAIFEDCGLGKTIQQLEWANQVCKKTSGNVLILAPLAVSKQTRREGEKFGIDVNIVENHCDIKKGISITNYEKLHKFDVSVFDGVVLDEASIIKSFTGKTKKQIIDLFAKTPYKLECTATPAPNDYVELGNHAEFLGVMSRQEMLSMFFINDTANTGTWRLKGHAQKEFWGWVCSWAVMIKKPSDIGFSDDGFVLPGITFHDHVIKQDGPSNGMLWAVEAKTLTERRNARRNSIYERCQIAADLVNKSDDNWLVWCDLNDESKLLSEMINHSVEVKGADSQEHKEKSMLDFSQNKIKCLVSKPKIAGWGMNWQNCCNVAFVGLSDSYEAFYQAVRRCYRFGQMETVNVHIITHQTEGSVVANVKRKEQDSITMADSMVEYMSDITREEINMTSNKKDEYKTSMTSGDNWDIHNADCVEMIKSVPDNSIHYSIFSPPFASLFTYSNSDRDMGNCKDSNEFLEHFKYLAGDLYRVLMPGRLLSFHVMNLPATITSDGYIGIKDLRGDLIRIFQDVDFIYHSEVCIWKDPLVQATRTKVLTLAHKQISKDASRCAQGLPDYVVTMRKPGDNPEPVAKGRGFERYVGEKKEPNAPKNNNPRINKYSHKVWQRYASPVWFDINQTRTLNEKMARDNEDERHMCPLQLDVIERCLELWTNDGDCVFSPFAGIGSEGYVSVEAGRKFIGVELKKSYFDVAVSNLRKAQNKATQPSLFDVVENAN